MRKLRIHGAALIAAAVLCPAVAQNAPAANAAATNAAPANPAVPMTNVPPGQPVYHLDFSVTEIDSGKRLNTRHYMAELRSSGTASFRTGNRVPVTTGANYQYMDVGINIDCNGREISNGLQLDTTIDISGLVALAENSELATYAAHGMPILRNMRAQASSVVTSGKSTVLNVIDDVVTGRRFEFAVTATRER